mmetsp:Transcript_66135/g.184150  ORF Transcript_66135/g.184150 Transcript_66135/m.184150 type:complete len:141 (-) Transcript_66135:34-456(-)
MRKSFAAELFEQSCKALAQERDAQEEARKEREKKWDIHVADLLSACEAECRKQAALARTTASIVVVDNIHADEWTKRWPTTGEQPIVQLVNGNPETGQDTSKYEYITRELEHALLAMGFTSVLLDYGFPTHVLVADLSWH